MKAFFLLAGFIAFHATPARAELCRLFHASLESGKPVHEILPDAVQLFAQVANEQNAIPLQLRARFLEDPFTFPPHDVERAEFRATLLELQKTFRESPDREFIRSRTRERLAVFRGTATSHEAESKTELPDTKPVRFVQRALSGTVIGNGDRAITQDGLLSESATDRLIDVSSLALGKSPKWTMIPASPDRHLVRKEGKPDGPIDWDVYLASPSAMTKVKLSKSPYPTSFFLRHFGNETTPHGLEGRLSSDGSTLLVIASSFVKQNGNPYPENGMRASLYDAATGKFLAAIPSSEGGGKYSDGRSWTERVENPRLTLSHDGKRVWISTRFGHVYEWRPGRRERAFFGDGANRIDYEEKASDLVLSPDGVRLYHTRTGIMRVLDAATGDLLRTANRSPGWFSEDGKFRWEFIDGESGRTLVVRDANDFDQIVLRLAIPEDTDFKQFTPDGSRLVFHKKYQNQIPLWHAIYSLEDLKRIGHFSTPTAWAEAKK